MLWSRGLRLCCIVQDVKPSDNVENGGGSKTSFTFLQGWLRQVTSTSSGGMDSHSSATVSRSTAAILVLLLNHTQLARILFSQLSAAVVRRKANDGVVHAIRAWFNYDTALYLQCYKLVLPTRLFIPAVWYLVLRHLFIDCTCSARPRYLAVDTLKEHVENIESRNIFFSF